MKTTELRVNNYVYYKGKVCEVTAIFDEQRNTIELKGYKARIDLSRYNPPVPVLLTVKLLKDFRFKKNASGWGFKSLQLYGRFNFNYGYGTKIVKIKYVHTLQNLYFALTGKELTK